MPDHTTITLGNISARMLAHLLRDLRIRPIAIEYYATGAIEELLRQLPEHGEPSVKPGS